MPSSDQILSRLRRTMQSIFRIGDIQVKDNVGEMQARNADDSDFADFHAENVTVETLTNTAQLRVTTGPQDDYYLLSDASGNATWQDGRRKTFWSGV